MIDCPAPHFGHGYCQVHHYRWRKHGDPLIVGKPAPRKPGPGKPCGVTDCPQRARKKGFCERHFGRLLRHGDAAIEMPLRRSHHEVWTRAQWVEAFNSRFVRSASECLEWTGNLNENGYGRFVFEGRQWFTHRLAYTLSVGPIPQGLFVCHRCDNPACGDPAHLFVGTSADNLADMRAKGRGFVPPPAKGSAHPKTALADQDVYGIRAAHAGGENQSAIARRLGIGRGVVANICQGKTWRHLT